MSNEIMDGNRVLAEFDGEYLKAEDTFILSSKKGAYFVKAHDLQYHESYDWLMPVWEKFRELKYSNEVHWQLSIYHIHRVSSAMTDGTLTDLYNALVNAVKWYNEVTKQKQ